MEASYFRNLNITIVLTTINACRFSPRLLLALAVVVSVAVGETSFIRKPRHVVEGQPHAHPHPTSSPSAAPTTIEVLHPVGTSAPAQDQIVTELPPADENFTEADYYYDAEVEAAIDHLENIAAKHTSPLTVTKQDIQDILSNEETVWVLARCFEVPETCQSPTALLMLSEYTYKVIIHSFYSSHQHD